MRGVLAIALATTVSAQLPPGRAETTLVRLDVVALDSGGDVVGDLGLDDFEVVENGTLRTLEDVRLVRAEGRRVFAIFLDEYHVTPAGARRASDALIQLVEQAMGPRDLAIVLKPLDSLVALRLTDDRSEILRAIAAFEGRKGIYAPRNGFEEHFLAGTPARIDALRAQIATSALNALGTYLGAAGVGRKTIIAVTEGFVAPERRRGDEMLPTIEAVVRSANRATASIYPIDPTAPAAGRSAAHDMLRRLAAETGGRAIVGAGELAAGMRQVATDSSAYYLVAFRSARREPTATFHPVEIRVRRAGIQVKARAGYWLPPPMDAVSTPAGPDVVALPQVPLRISPLIRTWFGLARGADGRTRVSFVWEPVAGMPGDPTRVAAPARITLKALGADGTAVFEGTVRPAGRSGFDAPDREPAQAVFEATPGRLRVQMSIEDEASKALDSDVRELPVAAFTGQVALGTPQVFRARNAREHRRIDADPDAVPVVGREFSRAERLLIRVPVYSPGGDPEVSANLLSRTGGQLRALPVASGPLPDLRQIDLPLAAFAAGEYAVELIANGPAGTAKDVVTFRVTP